MAAVRSTIVRPACRHRESEIMPEDACQYFYQCKGCRVVLKPKKGDCCVFCSYGDVKCLTAQRNNEGRERNWCPHWFLVCSLRLAHGR